MMKNVLDFQQIFVILKLKLVVLVRGTSVLVRPTQEKSTRLILDAADCVTGDDCEAVLCPPGEYCADQKFCVNVTATTGSGRLL
jgi:hypothetical protein